MQNKFMIAVVLAILSASNPSPAFGQTTAEDMARLQERVAQLEQQVQEMSKLLEPIRAQQAVDGRRKIHRAKFEAKMAEDRGKYTPEQLREAEALYQVANQKWGSPEAAESLQTMIKKYPDINRTGCAVLYIAQKSQGTERAAYLRDCIERFNDCMYGDGVQVGAYARFLLAWDCKNSGETVKANELRAELQSKYPDAVDHGGNLLMEGLSWE
jgi:hypothetical protein